MDQFNIVADMVKEAERHANSLSKDRIRAIEYNKGEMKDTPADSGKSQMVTKDVRAQIKKVLPSITRTILGSDEVVEYQPVEQGDEEGADQASDYMNYVVIEESGARKAIYDALYDALLLRNGILKWWFEEKAKVSYSDHSGLNDDAFAVLVADDEVEVVEHTERQEDVEGQTFAVHDVKIKRTRTERKPMAAAVSRERLLIHPDAVSLQDSLLTGEKSEERRSDLIAMGYNKDRVFGFALAGENDDESDVRRDTITDADEAQRANELVDYYDLYIRVDLDGDGIAELRHMCFAGGLAEKNLLLDEPVDEIQLCDIAVMRQPHQWEGISLADDLMDIQRAKTVLLRQTLDNLYWQNNPQPVYQKGAIKNKNPIFNPEFGLPIEVNDGFDVRAALGFNNVPFVAKESFGMLSYLDEEATDRTGVSDASSGMAPDALQNMTAKASAMIEQAGIGQTELMVRTAAEGLAVFFRGMLRLITRHQDVSRTVRLRDEWIEFDPRHWNAAMDAKVNTGLGAGTRERDLIVMQQVISLQEKMLAGFGPDNPFVKPDNVYAAISRLVESAGLKTPSLYFTEPDEAEVQAKLEAMRSQPNPEQMKIQAQMQLEQAKMAVNRDKEKAQMEADLAVADADREAGMAKLDKQLAWEREKFLMQRQDEQQKFQAEQVSKLFGPQAA